MNHTITLNAAELFAIRQFTAKQDIRYYLNGVCIRNGCLDATNGHYLARVELSPESMPDQGSTYNAPAVRLSNDDLDRFFKTLGTSAKNLEKYVTVSFDIIGARWVGSISTNGASVSFEMPVDQFPTFEPLLNQNADLTVHPSETPPLLNWDYLALFNKAARILTGNKKINATIIPANEYESTVVLIPGYPRFHGLLMPLRDQGEQKQAINERLDQIRQYRETLAYFTKKEETTV